MVENHRDREATKARSFKDKRSYVSLSNHEYLFGADVGIRRQFVFMRDCGRCQSCGVYTGEEFGHMDHIIGGNTKSRCSCLHNLRWLCKNCHLAKHNREPKWGIASQLRSKRLLGLA